MSRLDRHGEHDVRRGTICFRVDATADIGGGHVMRCLTLADEMAASGWECWFAGVPETDRTVAALARSPHRFVAIGTGDDQEATGLARRFPAGVDWLVVDHYGKGAEDHAAFRPWARRLMVIDDLADRPHDCDLLVDQNAGRREADYRPLVGADCRIRVGTDFALLRSQFARRRPAALARRRDESRIERVLVSFGMSDPTSATVSALDAIAASGLDVHVDVAIGAAARGLPEIRHAIARLSLSVDLHLDADDMAALMARADLAIGGAGSSAWERCCLGLPSVVVITGFDQHHVAEALAENGAAVVVGEQDRSAVEDLAREIRDVASDAERRIGLGRRAARICDGLGARRVAAILGPEHAADGGAVELRPATGDDGPIMLDWQRQPRTRRYFATPCAPAPDEHFQWLDRRLGDTDCLLNIIVHRGRPVGVLRLDRDATEPQARSVFEISILVAPENYRAGLGSAALRLARRLLPDAELRARVTPGNTASRNLFRKAGFVDEGEFFWSRPGAASVAASDSSVTA